MLEAIGISQDSMAYEVLGNIIAESRKRGEFGGFSEERMKSLLEGMRNKVEYALKDSKQLAGQLEECSDSKGIPSVLNGRTFKYHFGGGRFHMLSHSYPFCHVLCLNFLLQVWLIGNQRDQVSLFRYINQADEVSHLLEEVKYWGI